MNPRTKQKLSEFILAAGIVIVVIAAAAILAYFLIPRNMM